MRAICKFMLTKAKSTKDIIQNYLSISKGVPKDLLKLGVRQPKRDKESPETLT